MLSTKKYIFDIPLLGGVRGGFMGAATVVLYLLTIVAAQAQQQPQTINLDSVLQRISKSNPMLQKYDYRAKAMDAYAEGAKSWMAPMVGAGTFMTPYPNQMLMKEGDRGAWMFAIEQEIPNPGKLKANENYLEARGDVAKEGRAIQFNALRAEAKSQYFKWLVA